MSLLLWSAAALADQESGTADRAIEFLSRSPSGKALLFRAQKFWGESKISDLKKHFRYGEVSRTDAVLTRHYNPTTGQEVRERLVTVIIRPDQNIEDVALDLAHELTHAVSQPSWDPYDPTLTTGRYIWASLESPGGEIEAVTQECQVALEISQYMEGRTSTRCHRYHRMNPTHEWSVDTKAVRKDFYRVGKSYGFIKKRLGDEITKFPELTDDAPELYSATGSAPYPLALIREYDDLNRVACENVQKRMKNQKGRAPASMELLSNRCQSVKLRQSVTTQE